MRILLVCLLALPALCGEDDEKMVREVIEARLKAADRLRAKGDLEGALKIYKEAVALWEQLKNPKAADAPAAQAPARPRAQAPAPPAPVQKQEAPWGLGMGGRKQLRKVLAPQKTEVAVEKALKWLAGHQDVDGRWDTDQFMKHDQKNPCDGAGGALHDVGSTGLALLAFLGAGYTDRGNQPYAKTVRAGVRFLMASQDPAGVFGKRTSMHWMYNHALATLALCEAYAMTRNPRYRAPAQAGLDLIQKARNPFMAWRYEPRGGENDTSVTAWCIQALRAGEFAGFNVDQGAYKGALAWLDKVTDPVTGTVGYNIAGGTCARPEGMQNLFPAEKSQAMTAAGIFTRLLCGENPPNAALLRRGVRLCAGLPPVWDVKAGRTDMYYWYYGTYAMFQMGGAEWQAWSKALADALLANQKQAGSEAGSWDPVGPWGRDGGRIYSTALMTLCLEAQYRYEKIAK